MNSECEIETEAGTLHYASPEKINGTGYGLEDDIWALGCITYEMCATVSPFFGANDNEYALKKLISKAFYPPPSASCFSKQVIFCLI